MVTPTKRFITKKEPTTMKNRKKRADHLSVSIGGTCPVSGKHSRDVTSSRVCVTAVIAEQISGKSEVNLKLNCEVGSSRRVIHPRTPNNSRELPKTWVQHR